MRLSDQSACLVPICLSYSLLIYFHPGMHDIPDKMAFPVRCADSAPRALPVTVRRVLPVPVRRVLPVPVLRACCPCLKGSIFLNALMHH